MKLKQVISICILNLFIISCGIDRTEHNINNLLSSGNADDLVEAYYLIGESEETKYIPQIFADVNDVRISHNLAFKGISVYQSKMIALKKISGLKPPIPITNKKDLLVVAFYKKWAIKNHYLK